jgi:hypothetical protein
MKASHNWALDRALAHEVCERCKLQNQRILMLLPESMLTICDSCSEITGYVLYFIDGVTEYRADVLLERVRRG